MNITVRNKENTKRDTFFTNATAEDIQWCIAVNDDRTYVRKSDMRRIKNTAKWVGYHLQRAGFEVAKKETKKPTYVIVLKK